MRFQGCGTALVTPFRRDKSLDEAALRRLVRRQVEAGIHFLVPCGTTGENPTLTRREHLRVVEIDIVREFKHGPQDLLFTFWSSYRRMATLLPPSDLTDEFLPLSDKHQHCRIDEVDLFTNAAG